MHKQNDRRDSLESSKSCADLEVVQEVVRKNKRRNENIKVGESLHDSQSEDLEELSFCSKNAWIDSNAREGNQVRK